MPDPINQGVEPTSTPTYGPISAPPMYSPMFANPSQTARTYTHEEYTSMSTSQYLTGIAQVARRLNVELDVENSPKNQIKQIADAVAAQIKAAEDNLAAKANGEAQIALAQLQQQVEAMKAGIPADKVERVIKYANILIDDKTDFAAALKIARDDLGIGKNAEPQVQPPSTKPQIIAGQNPVPAVPPKRWKEMGIRERTELYKSNPDAARKLAAADGEEL